MSKELNYRKALTFHSYWGTCWDKETRLKYAWKIIFRNDKIKQTILDMQNYTGELEWEAWKKHERNRFKEGGKRAYRKYCQYWKIIDKLRNLWRLKLWRVVRFGKISDEESWGSSWMIQIQYIGKFSY